MYKCVQNCSTAKSRCNSGWDARDWDPSEGKTLETAPIQNCKQTTFHKTFTQVKDKIYKNCTSPNFSARPSRKSLALAARAFCHRPPLLSRSKRAAVSTRKPSHKMMMMRRKNSGHQTVPIQKCVYNLQVSYLPSKFRHVKRAKTAQLRASAHDYLKKTPRIGSQSILPSTSFDLAQQASSRERSKAFTKDDDDTTSLRQCANA